MNNPRGFPTNQQARLQENKQFFRGRFEQVESVTCQSSQRSPIS